MKLKRPTLLIPLLIAAIIVWYINVKLIARLGSGKPIAADTTITIAESLPDNEFIFKPVNRDPFNIVVDTGPSEPVMPQIDLRGIVITNKGALAMMEFSGNLVCPMKAGDSYEGVKIKSISSKEVVVNFHGQVHNFTITR